MTFPTSGRSPTLPSWHQARQAAWVLLSTCLQVLAWQLQGAHGTAALVKEAVEDLEWGALNASMSLELRRSPPEILMSASDSGEITIKLPVSVPAMLSQLCHALEISGWWHCAGS